METPRDLLYRFIVRHYDKEELRTLCFFLGVDYDNLRGEGKNSSVRELVLKLGREGQLDKLLTRLNKKDGDRFAESGLSTDPEFLRQLYDYLLLPTSEESSPLKAPPAPGEPPFKDLAHFEINDDRLFFGREELTAKLVNRLREYHFLAIIGPSGSGKSSLVRAGLISALQRGKPMCDGIHPPKGSTRWPIYLIPQTRHPLKQLATMLISDAQSTQDTQSFINDLVKSPDTLDLMVHRILKNQCADHLLLVIDQFEELFYLCQHEARRRAFINNLLTAVEAGGPTVLVIVLRADFYNHCAWYNDRLGKVLVEHREYVDRMTREQLRQAIERPAKNGHWEFEDGLVDLLLDEVVQEPGQLPLLSHALYKTWGEREGRTLTLRGYLKTGGVRGAIAKTAQTFYKEHNDKENVIRNIFLRLVEPGEGTQDIQRPALVEELITYPEKANEIKALLEELAENRLVTIKEESVEIAHNALIREWPLLDKWIGESRDGLRIHKKLVQSIEGWQRNERDGSYLYSGLKLKQAEEWAKEYSDFSNFLERNFLRKSRETEELNERKKEEDRKALQRAVTGLVVMLLFTISFAVFAIIKQQGEQRARKNAQQQARIALSRQLAVQSLNQLDDNHWELAMSLAIEAGRTADTSESFAALRQAFVHPGRTQVILSGHKAGVLSAVWSANGNRILTASEDSTACVWDAQRGEEVLKFSGHTGAVFQAKWNADESLILTASEVVCVNDFETTRPRI